MADHVATVECHPEQESYGKEDAQELLIAEQDLGFAIIRPQHFLSELYWNSVRPGDGNLTADPQSSL